MWISTPSRRADAHALERLGDAVLAADQDRRAQALIAPGDRRRDALLLLAFGEHDPLGVGLDALDHQLHAAGGGVEAALQLLAVALEVDQRAPRDPGLHGGLGHGHRHGADQARVERRRDQVFGAVAQPPAAIGGGHLVRHLLAREGGDGVGGGDLHGIVDGGRAHVERAAEDVGEAQDVVDLVGVVRLRPVATMASGADGPRPPRA